MRAVSWRATAKPEPHPDVPGRAGRRGERCSTLLGEISRVRAFEKPEVIVAKKPDNAGGAKDRRSRTGPMVDSSAGSQLPPETGRGEAPRTRHGRPFRRSSPSGGENRKERPFTRLERASSDSNRRILKTVRPVVWEGAGAQSPAPGFLPPHSGLTFRRDDGADEAMTSPSPRDGMKVCHSDEEKAT